MTGVIVEIYCDAGISPASMTSPIASGIQPTLVGRIVILIPSIDYGFIEQFREGILNKKGNPSSNLLEGVAIEKARQICLEKKLSSFMILTDNLSSANTMRFPEVEWLEAGRLL